MNVEGTRNRPSLRLIRGGGGHEVFLHGVRVVAAPPQLPPFAVEAVAAEEDTYLVLSAPAQVREPIEHPIRVMTAVLDAVGADPGSVVVRNGRPLRFLAVVHDLSEEPSWREEWVASAVDGILREARRLRLRSIGLPLLATRHGKLERDRFMVLLREALQRARPGTLERLWLIVPEGAGEELLKILAM
ncbi:MAG: hypothetical protein GY856_42655 [bacterium]|nr:hypothetical protein [bacterium]